MFCMRIFKSGDSKKEVEDEDLDAMANNTR